GSFARVFRAENLDTGKMIGVKLLRNRWNQDEETIDLFRREAELGMKLTHPNIVPIYSVGTENGHHFFTMQFVEGGNLRDFVQIRKQIRPLETLKYAIDIAKGLEYALRFGITHRDLKMTNVLFTVDGVAKLIDFGLATDDELLERVGEGGVHHALEYSTLEKGTGAPRNDPRSDLFFLGTIMYEMLLGQPPYPRTRSREERKQIMRYRNIRPLRDALPPCPRPVAEIVDRLLHSNPEERYQSATELLHDLREVHQTLEKADRAKSSESDIDPLGLKELTLMCVERRPREQDILREYFSRHGFRVLMISDVQRAAARLRSDPPDLLLCNLTYRKENQVADLYQGLVDAAVEKEVPSLMMVSDLAIRPSIPAEVEQWIHFREPMPLRNMRLELNEIASHPPASSSIT
ncbi:MAG: protein kinase, partial [Planctomycetaceae bacterium]|nr:protein kinase [Planctomycetaceae bacterium]